MRFLLRIDICQDAGPAANTGADMYGGAQQHRTRQQRQYCRILCPTPVGACSSCTQSASGYHSKQSEHVAGVSGVAPLLSVGKNRALSSTPPAHGGFKPPNKLCEIPQTCIAQQLETASGDPCLLNVWTRRCTCQRPCCWPWRHGYNYRLCIHTYVSQMSPLQSTGRDRVHGLLPSPEHWNVAIALTIDTSSAVAWHRYLKDDYQNASGDSETDSLQYVAVNTTGITLQLVQSCVQTSTPAADMRLKPSAREHETNTVQPSGFSNMASKYAATTLAVFSKVCRTDNTSMHDPHNVFFQLHAGIGLFKRDPETMRCLLQQNDKQT